MSEQQQTRVISHPDQLTDPEYNEVLTCHPDRLVEISGFTNLPMATLLEYHRSADHDNVRTLRLFLLTHSDANIDRASAWLVKRAVIQGQMDQAAAAMNLDPGTPPAQTGDLPREQVPMYSRPHAVEDRRHLDQIGVAVAPKSPSAAKLARLRASGRDHRSVPSTGPSFPPSDTPAPTGENVEGDSTDVLKQGNKRAKVFTDESKKKPKARQEAEDVRTKEERKAQLDEDEELLRAFEAGNRTAPRDEVPAVRFLTPYAFDHADRFAPSTVFMNDALAQKRHLLPLAKAERELGSEVPLLWVSVMNNSQPDTKDMDAFRQALESAVKDRVITDVNVQAMNLLLPKKVNGHSCHAFIAWFGSASDRNTVRDMNAFGFHDGKADRIFFVQSRHSIGNRVVYDIENAPVGKEDLLSGIHHNLLPWIDVNEKGEPRDLRIAQLLWSPSRALGDEASRWGVRSNNWRISFTPSEAARKAWTEPPTSLGSHESRGIVLLKNAPFCSACISLSHQREQCTWWRVMGVAAKPKAPAGASDLKWEAVKSWAEKPVEHAPSAKKSGAKKPRRN